MLTFVPGLLGIPILVLNGPIPQDLSYHDFADQRTIWGVPHFGDVLSNLPFVVIGLWGLLGRPKLDFAVFFWGIFLTGFGSAYYHWAPGNATLVWDRLPMTLGFMGFFSAVVRRRVNETGGRRLLWPLIAVGLASVWYWAETDDLRPYIMVQFYPLATVLLMLGLFPGPAKYYVLAVISYAAAKVPEALDEPIYEAAGLVSGHTLKHLLAALGAWWIVRMLALEREAESGSMESGRVP